MTCAHQVCTVDQATRCAQNVPWERKHLPMDKRTGVTHADLDDIRMLSVLPTALFVSQACTTFDTTLPAAIFCPKIVKHAEVDNIRTIKLAGAHAWRARSAREALSKQTRFAVSTQILEIVSLANSTLQTLTQEERCVTAVTLARGPRRKQGRPFVRRVWKGKFTL